MPSSILEEPVFSPVVILPTYNNGRTVIGVLDRAAALELPLIVVNDGCTDETAEALAAWKLRRRPPTADVTILTHSANRGKAAALHTGFAAAEAAGHTHAVTIDTDGQLDPEQIPELLEAARLQPRALVLGMRDATSADYPARSRLGRTLSNGAIRLECGRRIADSQCGLRVYPLELLRAVEQGGCHAPYFAFEAEIITKAGWAGFPIAQVPVNCRYLPPGEQVSHFRPFRDSLRGLALHLKLLARSVFPRQRLPHPADAHPTPAPAPATAQGGLSREAFPR
ncbi:MAG TPA: glycosyltransferase family 2 protein [Tepidisphaeraceae bacterium]